MIFLCDLWRFSCPHLTCCWQTKWCLLAFSHGLWFELLIQNSCQHLDSSSHWLRPTFLGQLSSHQRNLLDCSTKASATRIHLESSWVGKNWIKVASDFKLYAAGRFWFFHILIQIFFSLLASPWLSQLQESLTLERSKGCVCFNP